jgi:protein gp37
MANSSHIEWTDATWNPVTGCTKISPGCKHCYAERMSRRLQAMGQDNYSNGFKVTLQPQMLQLPLTWRRSRRIFVNSMSDLFHDDVPSEYIQRVFDVMGHASWHQYQVLTKRSNRLAKLDRVLNWHPSVWMGVSVENARYTHRIDDLRGTGARIKFLSLEPLLGPLRNLDLSGIDWVIVGGESGPNSRAMNPTWVHEIRDQCVAAGVAFFFKQWGGVFKKRTGRLLDDRTWDEMPQHCGALTPGRANELVIVA